MGFPPGIAEKMVWKAFQTFSLKTLDGKELPRDQVRDMTRQLLQSNVSAPSGSSKPAKESAKKTGPSHLPVAANVRDGSSKTVVSTQKLTRKNLEQQLKHVVLNEKGEQLPNAGNGGVSKTYFWHQTFKDVTIHLALPAEVDAKSLKSKDIDCSIRKDEIAVSVKAVGRSKGGLNILQGAFPKNRFVKASESLWSFSSEENQLVIELEKLDEVWWPSVLVGDEEIDLQQVNSVKEMHEFDEETQGTIRKIRFDQAQQRQELQMADQSSTRNMALDERVT